LGPSARQVRLTGAQDRNFGGIVENRDQGTLLDDVTAFEVNLVETPAHLETEMTVVVFNDPLIAARHFALGATT